jgi:hypothetical protein
MSHRVKFCHEATWVLHQKQINPEVAINKQFRLKRWFYLHWRRQDKQNLFQSVPERHYANHPESTCCTADGTQIGRGTTKRCTLKVSYWPKFLFSYRYMWCKRMLNHGSSRDKDDTFMISALDQEQAKPRSFWCWWWWWNYQVCPVPKRGTGISIFWNSVWFFIDSAVYLFFFVQSANGSILGSPFAWTYSILQALRCLHINMLLL